jgi:hypothetical protein
VVVCTNNDLLNPDVAIEIGGRALGGKIEPIRRASHLAFNYREGSWLKSSSRQAFSVAGALSCAMINELVQRRVVGSGLVSHVVDPRLKLIVPSFGDSRA